MAVSELTTPPASRSHWPLFIFTYWRGRQNVVVLLRDNRDDGLQERVHSGRPDGGCRAVLRHGRGRRRHRRPADDRRGISGNPLAHGRVRRAVEWCGRLVPAGARHPRQKVDGRPDGAVRSGRWSGGAGLPRRRSSKVSGPQCGPVRRHARFGRQHFRDVPIGRQVVRQNRITWVTCAPSKYIHIKKNKQKNNQNTHYLYNFRFFFFFFFLKEIIEAIDCNYEWDYVL